MQIRKRQLNDVRCGKPRGTEHAYRSTKKLSKLLSRKLNRKQQEYATGKKKQSFQLLYRFEEHFVQ